MHFKYFVVDKNNGGGLAAMFFQFEIKKTVFRAYILYYLMQDHQT